MSLSSLIKKVPIPTAGLALGLAALGNLLQPYSELARGICGILSLLLVVMLVAKIIMFPAMIRDDLHNSILASVSATLFMSVMQLSGYLAPFAMAVAFALWCAAVAGHIILMIWFTVRYIFRFKLHEVFPTYFICYVGIIVASVTAPTFSMEWLGNLLFWFGFACYMVLLVLVTIRYAKHEIPEGARPLFCIYAAPMSLSLAGYLASNPDPNPAFVGVLLIAAQILLIMVLTQLPKLAALNFYPSFAAMTFPFVISAFSLGRAVAFLDGAGIAIAAVPMLEALIALETIFAAVMVTYVACHYARFFFREIEEPQAADVVQEQAMNARFAENFEN
ncbi:MAG: TDT family transporter [Adlercreutzia sp.]|nr:TDT family transporter [Adlercreutzia sp.]